MKYIISAFPGSGKSTLVKMCVDGLYKGIPLHDSDSSSFSWLYAHGHRPACGLPAIWAPQGTVFPEGAVKIRNPNFISDYMEHIRGLEGIILVSTHAEVRQALYNEGLAYDLVYPSIGIKMEYMMRYHNRGSSSQFLEVLGQNWDQWINLIAKDLWARRKYELASGTFLADIVNEIISSDYERN